MPSKTPSKTIKKIVVPAGRRPTPRPVVRPPAPDPVELKKKLTEIKEANTPTPATKSDAVPVRYIIEMSDGTLRYAEGDHAKTLVAYLVDCQQHCRSKGLNYYGGPPLEVVTLDAYLKKREADGRQL